MTTMKTKFYAQLDIEAKKTSEIRKLVSQALDDGNETKLRKYLCKARDIEVKAFSTCLSASQGALGMEMYGKRIVLSIITQ